MRRRQKKNQMCASSSVEYLATNQGVVGSNPAWRTIKKVEVCSLRTFLFIYDFYKYLILLENSFQGKLQ